MYTINTQPPNTHTAIYTRTGHGITQQPTHRTARAGPGGGGRGSRHIYAYARQPCKPSHIHALAHHLNLHCTPISLAFGSTGAQPTASVSTATRSPLTADPGPRTLVPPRPSEHIHRCHVASAGAVMHATSPALYTQQRPRGTHCGVVRAVRAGRRTHSATLPHHHTAISPPLLHVAAPQHARMHMYSTCMYSCMHATTHSRRGWHACRSSLHGIQGPGSRVQGRPCRRGWAHSSQTPAPPLLFFLPPLC